MSEDLLVLREILQRELETINAYERMLERVTDASLREHIQHVTDEEREHVSEMYQLILQNDPQQRARAERGHVQSFGTAGALSKLEAQTAAAAAGLSPSALLSQDVAQDDPAAHSPSNSSSPLPTPEPPLDLAWSVGSLKGRSP